MIKEPSPLLSNYESARPTYVIEKNCIETYDAGDNNPSHIERGRRELLLWVPLKRGAILPSSSYYGDDLSDLENVCLAVTM